MNQRSGRGHYIAPDGFTYDGDWAGNLRHGSQWHNDERCGHGAAEYADASSWENDRWHGRGRYIDSNGVVSAGSWWLHGRPVSRIVFRHYKRTGHHATPAKCLARETANTAIELGARVKNGLCRKKPSPRVKTSAAATHTPRTNTMFTSYLIEPALFFFFRFICLCTCANRVCASCHGCCFCCFVVISRAAIRPKIQTLTSIGLKSNLLQNVLRPK
jgi:hypothetical protein